MKIVQGDQAPVQRGLEHRGGTIHFRYLMEGEPGTPGNFQLSLGLNGGDFFSPRHRHNFEQVRYQLAGTLDFGRNGKMTPGMVGYFPEGVYYGPQTQKADQDPPPETVVLQCGGASGSGYLSRDEVRAGMEALKQEGEFEDGVFRRRADVPGKRNMDGFQAIWEHVNGRPMIYPKPRYSGPMLMDPENYRWVATKDATGVSEKLLGVFTERRSEIAFIRIEPGSVYEASGRAVYLGVSGSGVVAQDTLRRLTTIYLDSGEDIAFRARAMVEILRLGLPDLDTPVATGVQRAEAAALVD
jgi:hypothetical protein